MKRLGILVKFGAAMACMVVALFMFDASAHAAPNQAPDPAYFSPYSDEEWLLTSHAFAPDLNYIDAPVSQMKIYSTTPNFQLTIHNPNVCRIGQSLDQPFRPTGSPVGAFTSFRVYPLEADEATPIRASLLASYTGQSMNQTDGAGCGASVTLNFSIATPSTIPGHAGMYVAYFEAVFGGTVRGYNNRFKLTLSDPNGIIAYSDGSSVVQAYKFAIIADRRPVEFWGRPTYWSTEVLPFGPSCDVKTPQNVQLRWFDDDYLQFNQNRNITMELQKFNASTRAFVSSQNLGTPTAGPNAPGSRTVLIEPGFIYQWVWHNVQYNNGLQFQMPFDSIYFYRPCLDFNLDPDISTIIAGGAVTGNVAEPGQTVEFRYRIINTGSTDSTPANCTIYGNSLVGYVPPPPAPRSTSSPGYVPPPVSCPAVFAAGSNTQIGVETITMPANRTVCRSLFVNPERQSPPGGSQGQEVCVIGASKPYLRVYGGDVSAGNGFSSGATATTCSLNTGAAVIGWNRGSAGTFAGAGAQFAVMALSSIYDFASAQGNSGGAPAGSGLAFSNASAAGSTFGGSFGALPCIPDLYARRPATTPFSGNLTASASGAYSANGPITISGNISGNKRISLFVNGDVIIDNRIRYTGGAWSTVNDIPLFQLVATGNIYIRGSVTQLDGLYVAQGSGGSNGIIYTCTNGNIPYATTALGSNCNSKLTINGSFIARSVQFMRSAGTLAQSNAAETAASGQGAEVFNYNPAMWLVAPFGQSETTNYDAITSLPPIL